MDRRDFLRLSGLACTSLVVLPVESLLAEKPAPDWRTFDVVTRVQVLKPSGVTRIWVPAALISSTPFQKTAFNKFVAQGASANMGISRADGLGVISAVFPAGVPPILVTTSRVALRNYEVDLSRANTRFMPSRAELQHFLQPTKLIPTDGIVKDTATRVVGSARSDEAKARLIYEWIVDNTFRNPKTRGCGLGDIRFMLESGDLGGKCADLNALYVGMARSVGLPARDVYGIRVAKSELGYQSLGAASANITKAQHCRAEVYLQNSGWVPVDPADVRKVVLEEPPGNLSVDDDMVRRARARLFGSWEMNWMAYNFAHDVALPGSTGPAVPFLMYPQAETAQGRVDSLDPDDFQYEITVKEVTTEV